MISDFSIISRCDFDKNTGCYQFYSSDQKLIADTNDVIFTLDPAYNSVFITMLFNPPFGDNERIKNIYNCMIFPDKENDSIENINFEIIQILDKEYRVDVLCKGDIKEEKEFFKENKDIINDSVIDELKHLLIFGCSIYLKINNTKNRILFIFADFEDNLLLLGDFNFINKYKDKYGVIKQIITKDNIEIYIVDLNIISNLLIEQKDIIIRDKVIRESGRDFLKFLTLRKFAFKKDNEYIVPRNPNLYKNEYIRNMMIYFNNLSNYTKSRMNMDIYYFREDFYENYKRCYKKCMKKGKIYFYYSLFKIDKSIDYKENNTLKVEEKYVKEVWEKESKSDNEKTNKKYEDFLKFLEEKKVKIIQDNEDDD